MKMLFINSIDTSREIETRYPPLGIGYLVSSLREQFDDIEFKVINDNVEQELKTFKPHIVGISCVSQNYGRAKEYATLVKKYNLPVLCGGVHISMLPTSLSKDMDVGIVGEGEETICELIKTFKKHKSFALHSLSFIKGVVYWDNDKIVITDKRDEIESLDKIPFPARDLLHIKPSTYMFTSRGCPYRCTFCASSRHWSKVRLFSAEYVVNEIEYLVNNRRVKFITLYDDIFAIDTKRVKEIVKLLSKKGLLGKVAFSCAGMRASLVNDKIIKLLKQMGVVSIGMGLESGCNDTLRYLKGDISVKDNEKALETIRRHKIGVFCSFIIGSPKETKEDVLQTLEFIKRNKIESYDVYLLTPFPGTPVWDYAKSRGLVSDDMDWDKLHIDFLEHYQSAIILSEKLTGKDIYNLFFQFSIQRRQQPTKREKARIVFLVPGESGCDFYRAIQPAVKISHHNIADVQMAKKGDGEEQILQYLEEADIIVFQRPLDKRVLRLCKQKIKKIVVDYDDDLLNISPLNPCYATMGTQEVTWIFPDGTKAQLWKDGMRNSLGKVDFDLKKNKERQEIMREILTNVDLITTTTDYLAEVFKKYNKNVVVLPNSIDFDKWKSLPLIKTDEIRIGWMGGWSHYEDWCSISGALEEIFKKYSYLNLKLVLMGMHFKGTTKNIPEDKVEFYFWEKYNAYPLKLSTLNIDIGLIPLVDTEFNRCKSSIKFYELASLKIPTVVSNVIPYNLDVKHNVTGLLYNNKKEFVEQLSKLIEDKALRKEIGENAYAEVHYRHNIDITIEKYATVYKELLQ